VNTRALHAGLGVVTLLAANCGTPAGDSQRVLERAAESEFGSSAYGCIDTVEVAQEAGVDYRKTVDGCLARDRKSMHTFFWLTRHAGFDAASSQGHAAVTGVLFRTLGDRFFGQCLFKETPSIQNAVRDHLLYDLGYGDTDTTLAEVKRKYPRTFPGEWTGSKP